MLVDYREPRYDRGYIVNNADLKDDLIEQLNSYVLSNVSPQECHFNRGIWLSLKVPIQQWARDYRRLYNRKHGAGWERGARRS